MGLNLKQVLDDAKTYPDTTEFTVGNDKVTLGELRTARAQMEEEVAKKNKAADARFEEVTRYATEAAKIKADLEKQLADATKAGNKGNDRSRTEDDEANDPFWNPIRKVYDARLAAVDDNIKKFDDTMKKLASAMERATTIWAEDRWRSQFDRLQPRLAKVEKHKNMTFEEVRDFAAKERILDAHGLPSVEKAILQLTQQSEREIAEREAYERGLREGQTRRHLAATGRPASASGPPAPVKSHVKEKGLEGLVDDVTEDKELTDMLAELGAANPADFGGTPS